MLQGGNDDPDAAMAGAPQRGTLGHWSGKNASFLDRVGRWSMPVEEANAVQGEGAVRRVQQHLCQPSISIGEVPYVPVDVLQRVL